MLQGGRTGRDASATRGPVSRVVKKVGWPVLAVSSAILVQLVLSLVMTRGAWMTADPLYYITERGGLPGPHESLFAAHHGHWLTVPILIYRLLFPVLGLAHGWAYLLVSLLVHFWIVALMYQLLRRASWGPGTAAVSVLPVVFLGVGSQVYVADHPMPLALSVALGLAALLQLAVNRPVTGVVGAVLLLLLSVMSSGVGLVLLVTVGFWLLLARGLRAALVATVPAGVAFVVWFLVFGGNYDRAPFRAGDYLSIPQLVWKGATGALESASGIPGSGAVLLGLLLLAPLVARRLPPEACHLAWAGQVGALTQLTLSAIGGGTQEYPPVTESRYSYIVLVLLTPSLALVLVALRDASRRLRPGVLPVVVGVLAVAYFVNAMYLQRIQANAFVSVSSQLRDSVEGAVVASKAGEKVLTARPSGFSERMNVRLMMAPRVASTLPKEKVDTQGRLDAESEFFVGVGPDTFGLFAPEIAASVSFSEPLAPGESCQTYTTVTDHPDIAVDTGDGVEISVSGPATKATTRLERGPDVSTSRSWSVKPGIPIHYASTARDARLVVSFDVGGEFVICKH